MSFIFLHSFPLLPSLPLRSSTKSHPKMLIEPRVIIALQIYLGYNTFLPALSSSSLLLLHSHSFIHPFFPHLSLSSTSSLLHLPPPPAHSLHVPWFLLPLQISQATWAASGGDCACAASNLCSTTAGSTSPRGGRFTGDWWPLGSEGGEAGIWECEGCGLFGPLSGGQCCLGGCTEEVCAFGVYRHCVLIDYSIC